MPEASVRCHLAVYLDSSSQEVQEDPVREWEGWDKHKCVVLEQCRDRVRDQPTSFNRMCVTNLHKDIQEPWLCSHKNKCHRPSTYL